jgi:ATP-dependent DNA ligase
MSYYSNEIHQYSTYIVFIGAKYGTGRRSNKMAQFLVAVRDDRIPDTEDPK